LGRGKLRRLLEDRIYETAIVSLYLRQEYLEEVVNEIIEALKERGILDHDPREGFPEGEVTEEGHIVVFERDERDSKGTSRADGVRDNDSNRGSSTISNADKTTTG